jgi:Arc/MetJ-type ribon-helix-helix transcriptional regulator
MRTIVNISVPKEVAKEVKHTARDGGFASVSEYFRHLHREEKRRKLLQELRADSRAFRKGKGKALRSLRDLR